jgi:hypothetical protein
MWVWENMFGKCVAGSHPLVAGKTVRSSSLFTVLHTRKKQSIVVRTQKTIACRWRDGGQNRFNEKIPCLKTPVQREVALVGGVKMGTANKKISSVEVNDFSQVEQLGTHVNPMCGGCKCGKCPVPGSRFPFREEAELRMVDEGLRYDRRFHRELLKGNMEVAHKSLVATEKRLKKNMVWGETYCKHIEEMVLRGALP